MGPLARQGRLEFPDTCHTLPLSPFAPPLNRRQSVAHVSGGPALQLHAHRSYESITEHLSKCERTPCDWEKHLGRLQVTPSSKVVGDLAQFMVANGLDEHSLLEQAEQLSLPSR
jgi:pyruvate carboxylase